MGTDHCGTDPSRVALFTDTLGDVNGVTRFIKAMGELASVGGRELHIITSTKMEVPLGAHIHNLRPHFATKMPRYDHLEIVFPPIRDALRLVDQIHPDVIHVSTPGPVGTLGLVASAMKRVPVVGTYHTDFPAYVEDLFDDHVMTRAANHSMKLFYRRFSTVLTRSAAYLQPLRDIGVDDDRLEVLSAGCDTDAFSPRWRDDQIWNRLGVDPGVKVLYCGRVSVEKNLPMLTDVWTRASRRLSELGIDSQLVVIGDGPYRKRMEKELARAPAIFLGFRHGEELSSLYASGDVFVFPSLTDTLGQAVMEAQASGLPAIVSDVGGAQGDRRSPANWSGRLGLGRAGVGRGRRDAGSRARTAHRDGKRGPRHHGPIFQHQDVRAFLECPRACLGGVSGSQGSWSERTTCNTAAGIPGLIVSLPCACSSASPAKLP